MIAGRAARAAAVGVIAVLGLAALAGCGSSTSPGTGGPASTAALPSPGVTRAAASCSGAPESSTRLLTVPYSSLGDLADFTAAVARAGSRAVTLPAGVQSFTDFRSDDGKLEGGLVGPAATGLIGAGEDATTLELAPRSSTHAIDVPAAFPATNPLYVLRVAGDDAVLKGFTVLGTDQGHLYNGVRIDRVAGLRASDLRVVGIPGGSASPPGETFGINDFKTSGSLWSHITVDGAGVGASGFGVNSSVDTTICDSDSSDNAYGMGFAFWQSSGIRCVDCTAIGNGYSGFNFERVTGSNTLIRPVAHGNRYDMRIASDQSSAKITVIDPQLVDGHWTVTLPRTFYGRPNQQRAADVRLVIDGKDRPDLLRFATP